jgi:TM2 domain-containing membrane protein YozV
MYIMTNGKYFHSHQLPQLRERLIDMDDSKLMMVQAAPVKNPQTSLIVSILCGNLGIDRFMIGDVGLGIGKLLTCGGLGVWTIVDWFMIQNATKDKNFNNIQQFLC